MQCAQQLHCQQAWCAGERSGALKSLLDTYKFSSSRAGAVVLADLLDAILPVLPQDITLVGIPTSSTTRRVRGFDHIALIVNALAKRRHLSVAHPFVRNSSQTLHFLPKKERVRLGPTLFRLSGGPIPAHVLLIDDIVTTGTTLHAAAKLLQQAGVEQLYVATIARQPDERFVSQKKTRQAIKA